MKRQYHYCEKLGRQRDHVQGKVNVTSLYHLYANEADTCMISESNQQLNCNRITEIKQQIQRNSNFNRKIQATKIKQAVNNELER